MSMHDTGHAVHATHSSASYLAKESMSAETIKHVGHGNWATAHMKAGTQAQPDSRRSTAGGRTALCLQQ